MLIIITIEHCIEIQNGKERTDYYDSGRKNPGLC